MKRYLLALAFVLFALPTFAQVPPVKNPTQLIFTSADHDLVDVTGYEIDIIRADNTVVQTISVPKSSTSKIVATGEISITLSVQPIAFGNYTIVARTVAAVLGIKSDNSLPTDVWTRAPGAPSKPKVK